ncbi:MAG: NAD(P)H-hydrate dehydratase [Clostridium fessum]
MQNVLLSAYVPIIVDADGLNAVAQHPHLSGYFTENVIVTPHLGEMARLTGTFD